MARTGTVNEWGRAEAFPHAGAGVEKNNLLSWVNANKAKVVAIVAALGLGVGLATVNGEQTTTGEKLGPGGVPEGGDGHHLALGAAEIKKVTGAISPQIKNMIAMAEQPGATGTETAPQIAMIDMKKIMDETDVAVPGTIPSATEVASATGSIVSGTDVAGATDDFDIDGFINDFTDENKAELAAMQKENAAEAKRVAEETEQMLKDRIASSQEK